MREREIVVNIEIFPSQHQVDAIRRGVLKSVPQAVIDLLTWQELEKKICGDPEISVEALQKSSMLRFISIRYWVSTPSALES